MSEVNVYKMWYYLLKINNSAKITIIEEFKDEEVIYNNIEYILNIKKIKYSDYNKTNELEKAKSIIESISKSNIKFLTYTDDGYPKMLKYTIDAPYALFYKGRKEILSTRNVAIIGSRKASVYGGEITKLLTKELNSYNITIISGGARGIDTVAHKSTLNNGGNTIVVLGCGIDVTYPKENKKLFDEVIEKGVIVSEFLPGTPPLKYNFPIRNRIISGMSELVIVVEAAKRSGTLITVDYALEQGREVMAVPGMIIGGGSSGCLNLIKDGAHMFTEMEDLRFVLGLEEQRCYDNNLSNIENKILDIIDGEPTHIDKISDQSFVDRIALYKVLFEMQKKNVIVSLPGNYYAKII